MTMVTWPSPESLPDLSEHQREQYAKAAHGCLGILGGRPGTGKTFSLARILAAIPSGRSAVVAPTGKAAVRITESLQRAGVKNKRATTIHSLLGPSLDEETGWAFEHDEDHPLPLDWIFVDEGSMLDTPLFGSLLAARAPGARVMLIGDVNQLAPVGHGAPLRDMISAGLPYGELTEIRRNAGRIVRCCHGIIDKHRFEPSPTLDLAAESPENLLHVERRDPEQQIEMVKAMLDKFRNGARLSERSISPLWDCQVVVPVNEKSPLARKRLNGILQGFLNPGGERVEGSPFRVGDKIVCGKNGWVPVDFDTIHKYTKAPCKRLNGMQRFLNPGGERVEACNTDAKDGKVYVANGEQAGVLAVFPRYTVARLWIPDRVVRIPKGESYTDDNGEAQETGCNWDLAYAISVHKSQGSEFPVVITIADGYPGARMLCTREWWYTALSRAETMAVTIGQRDVIEGAIQKSGLWARKTFLKETIIELGQAAMVRGWEAALA